MNQITQEAIYSEMNTRNRTVAIQTYNCDTEPTQYCLAAYSLGQWHLLEAFRRLHIWLDEVFGNEKDRYITTYVPAGAVAATNGILHQTLLQLVSFQRYPELTEDQQLEIVACTKGILESEGFGTTITYRGLVFTSTGMALCGYSHDYERIMQLRERIENELCGRGLPCHIPYKNDILHATLFRWKEVPTEAIRARLLEGAVRWSEAVFGHIQIATYTVGLGTLLMRDKRDITTVTTPLKIYHRGNSALAPNVENDPSIIEQLVACGQHVEIDIWHKSGIYYLGHDHPTYPVTIDWICDKKEYLLIHCKDGATFSILNSLNGDGAYELHLFYHTTEDYALTTRGWIIAYPGKRLYPNCLNMMAPTMTNVIPGWNYFAICNDLL